MTKRIVIAVDTGERTRDPIALGRVLAAATGAPAGLLNVFPHDPLTADAPELVPVRDETRSTLRQLGSAEGLDVADAEAIAGNSAARELQRVTERPETGLVVVGSTTRGPLGRLLVGGNGERLLAGAACPVAIAPRGYAEAHPERLGCVGVGVDGSDEAQHALEAAVAVARAAGARLRVITAFQRLAFGGVAAAALPSRSANDEMRDQLRAVHDAAMGGAERHVEVEGRFVDGSVDQVLVAESAELDLLVAGSRGYGPIGAVLLGSATTHLARNASCPLLVTPRGTRFALLDQDER